MIGRTLIVGSAALALVAAGCGSSSKSSSSGSSPSSSGGSGAASNRPLPGRTYSVSLKGRGEVPPGSGTGSGKAVISIRGKASQLCWKFSKLTGFDKPTAAHVHTGPAGVSGAVLVPLGGSFSPKGCTAAPRSALSAIEASPKGHYVNVHSAKHPNGAVRAQL